MLTKIVGGLVAVVVVLGLGTLAVSCGTVPQSEVGFQVGGGPLDPAKNKVKSDLLKPGRRVLGTLDGVWLFPSNKTLRFQDFNLPVTTVDGKKLELAGQMVFRFVGEKDPALSREFAEGLGARKYGPSGDRKRPGEDEAGWTFMLDQLVTPEINATLKDGIGRDYCADFEPACRAIDPRKDVPASNPEAVYDELSAQLQSRVNAKLGAAYLQEIRIRVQTITLPEAVQSNIDRVTEEQAKTKAAEQSVQTAGKEAQAIDKRGAAIRRNPQQVAIEVAKVCNGGERCTIIVDAAGGGVKATVPVR